MQNIQADTLHQLAESKLPGLISSLSEMETIAKGLFGISNLIEDRSFYDFMVCLHLYKHGIHHTKILGRTGNDFRNQYGEEVEFKTKGLYVSGYSTSPNLSLPIIQRYRSVPYFVFAVFDVRILTDVFIVPSERLKPYFDKWESQIIDSAKKSINARTFSDGFIQDLAIPLEEIPHLNNPKIKGSDIPRIGTHYPANRNILDEFF